MYCDCFNTALFDPTNRLCESCSLEWREDQRCELLNIVLCPLSGSPRVQTTLRAEETVSLGIDFPNQYLSFQTHHGRLRQSRLEMTSFRYNLLSIFSK